MMSVVPRPICRLPLAHENVHEEENDIFGWWAGNVGKFDLQSGIILTCVTNNCLRKFIEVLAKRLGLVGQYTEISSENCLGSTTVSLR